MTFQSRYRTLITVAAVSLIAPLALVATTVATSDAVAATPKHKHEVTMYKVEKYVKLKGVGTNTVGDTGSQSLSCNTGDFVLDGMWMVSHVDQYNPDPVDPDDDTGYDPVVTGGVFNDERDVWVQASYPSPLPGNFKTWNFVIENKAYGDAQLKLYITCIKGKTEANSHQHSINVGPLYSGAPVATVANGSRSYVDVLPACALNEYLVAPGFDLLSTNHRVIGSYPTPGSSGHSWTWEFGTDAVTLPNVNVYARCIDRRVFTGVVAKHAIAMKHLPSLNFASWFASDIPPGDRQEVQYSCDQDNSDYHNYKAMVGWYRLGNNWADNWFLGMEPRPKTRVYSFWNHDVADADVKVGTLCINGRTGNPIP